MKKLLPCIALLLFASSSLKAQFVDKAEVPEAVTSSFSSAHPSVADGVWEKEGKKFMVSFKTDTVNHIVTFDTKGKMTGHQYTISVSDLPKDVVTGGSKAYPDLELTGADKIEQEGKISYILKYKNGNSPLRVQLTEKGTVIKLFDAQ